MPIDFADAQERAWKVAQANIWERIARAFLGGLTPEQVCLARAGKYQEARALNDPNGE